MCFCRLKAPGLSSLVREEPGNEYTALSLGIARFDCFHTPSGSLTVKGLVSAGVPDPACTHWEVIPALPRRLGLPLLPSDLWGHDQPRCPVQGCACRDGQAREHVASDRWTPSGLQSAEFGRACPSAALSADAQRGFKG